MYINRLYIIIKILYKNFVAGLHARETRPTTMHQLVYESMKLKPFKTVKLEIIEL
jgi:hypothetical protein